VVQHCYQGDLCCETRQERVSNNAATSEIIPARSIRRSKLIRSQLRLDVVYIIYCIASENTINEFPELQKSGRSIWPSSNVQPVFVWTMRELIKLGRLDS
jgi:hypothetical protein